MWVIWFGPMVVVCFLAGMTIAAVLLRLGKLQSPRSALAAVALPFGCGALPVLALALFSLAASIFGPDSLALYAELFGPDPSAVSSPGRMLSDAFGAGPTREILLRIDPTPAERARLMTLPGLTHSDMTPEDFAQRGAQRGLGNWWMRPASPGTINREPGTDCLSPVIYQADGFNGWRELRLALCTPERGDAFSMFVAAYGR
ncbi:MULTISPECIES: hypothetical protein [unclassified Novosphingobium]|uniref:hypothetical protein n=1 Tax=unclassified Novosphingobium TaxID=2644732 RepID=UPI0013576241|nr:MULTISPECIES: hypothetical protein [unclassified Novosphingobium]